MAVRVKQPTKIVSRGSIDGTGKTIAEAKADLNAKIDAALEGYYNPIVVTYKGLSAFVHRRLDGWGYKLLSSADLSQDGVMDAWATSQGFSTREEAEQSAAFHVIDLGDTDFHSDDDIPAFLTDQRKREMILSNARFRRAYAWARENQPDGANNDHLYHQWACWNSSDPKFA